MRTTLFFTANSVLFHYILLTVFSVQVLEEVVLKAINTFDKVPEMMQRKPRACQKGAASNLLVFCHYKHMLLNPLSITQKWIIVRLLTLSISWQRASLSTVTFWTNDRIGHAGSYQLERPENGADRDQVHLSSVVCYVPYNCRSVFIYVAPNKRGKKRGQLVSS